VAPVNQTRLARLGLDRVLELFGPGQLAPQDLVMDIADLRLIDGVGEAGREPILTDQFRFLIAQ